MILWASVWTSFFFVVRTLFGLGTVPRWCGSAFYVGKFESNAERGSLHGLAIILVSSLVSWKYYGLVGFYKGSWWVNCDSESSVPRSG